MKVLPGWWRKEFLWVELGLAALATGAFCIWGEWFGGGDVVDRVLAKHRATVYGTLASTLGSLLGFVITTVSIVIAFATNERLAIVRRSKHYPTLWKVFLSAIKVLGCATVFAFVGLLMDREDAPMRWLVYISSFLVVLAILRLARCVWVLERIIEVVMKDTTAAGEG